MQVTGKVKRIDEVRQVSDKFKVKEFVLIEETNPEYPQHILMQCTQDRVEMLDGLKVGDKVKASVNIRGKAYTDKKSGQERHFVLIEAWKVEEA